MTSFCKLLPLLLKDAAQLLLLVIHLLCKKSISPNSKTLKYQMKTSSKCEGSDEVKEEDIIKIIWGDKSDV